ncbi:metallopeptidase family protein [Marivita sp.]|uniref:metallopeptidase family protein n=1 Tax=Marivita sp. TaxID=2003365 RepID=UPI0025C7310E|nr:metallopeptidase family protein [Marivita sp.]
MNADTDIDDILRYAEKALATLPKPFRDLSRDVLLDVVDWPPKRILAELQIDDRLELTGLYEGIPLPEKSNADPAPFPDRVWLFAEPILAEWRERGNETLEDLVGHIVVHEIAHHFGWTDEEIAEIDEWWR